MLKLAGAGLVILSCGFLGLGLSQAYFTRPRELRTLSAGLKMLETEIVFTATPLPLALARISERLEEPVALLFRVTARLLQEERGLPAAEAWEQGLEVLRERSSLTPADLDILRVLGQGLGASGREDQAKNLELARQHLHRQLAAAEEDANRQGKMWRTLGFLLGATVALLMY
ncbi:stage III sporulation protein SpoIIIAB [Moorellaceae bacterium AZ2]